MRKKSCQTDSLGELDKMRKTLPTKNLKTTLYQKYYFVKQFYCTPDDNIKN